MDAEYLDVRLREVGWTIIYECVKKLGGMFRLTQEGCLARKRLDPECGRDRLVRHGKTLDGDVDESTHRD